LHQNENIGIGQLRYELLTNISMKLGETA